MNIGNVVLAPTAAVMSASAIAGKLTGKTTGVPGSYAHITTNNKLDNKRTVQNEITKECVKDTLTVGGITVGTAAVGSLAVANSNKCADVFKKLTEKASEFLGNSTINGTNVKDAIKNTKVFEKLNSLPMAAKAGIAAGAVALAVVAPLAQIVTSAKAGYIEGKHEVK